MAKKRAKKTVKRANTKPARSVNGKNKSSKEEAVSKQITKINFQMQSS